PPRDWPGNLEREWHARLTSDAIHWSWLRYHKRPSLPATLFDILAGALRASHLARNGRIDVLHARGHVAAAMGALVKPWSGSRLIFDIRGLMPDEYVDAGIWSKHGLRYRLTKRAEKWLLDAADG